MWLRAKKWLRLSPRSGRVEIAQHFSAGISKRGGSQSVKRTAEHAIQRFSSAHFSRPLNGLLFRLLDSSQH